jgi:catechol 2,3-dioxygenase-like lactoylglutathione lyase family enzyme
MSDYIKPMGHVALRVPHLEASVSWATTVLGMRETERAEGVSYLTHADCHHSLQYMGSDSAALDHVAMEAHDDGALDALVERLGERGVPVLSAEPQERGLRRAIRFRGPDGQVSDGRTYEPGHWPLDDPRFANLWGPGPPPEMVETATPLADG